MAMDPNFVFLRPNYSFSFTPAAVESVRQAEEGWVAHIKQALRRTEPRPSPSAHPSSTSKPSIFMAPSPLRALKHEVFVPQVVALGPYHCDLGPQHSTFPRNDETERYKAIAAKEMELHKIMASKYVELNLPTRDFSTIATKFLAMTPMIRAEYYTDALLTCKVDEKLAYLLALDASFVVEVLKSNAGIGSDGGFHNYYCSRFPHPLRKSVLQDFILLENQIPLFLLLEVIRMVLPPKDEDAHDEDDDDGAKAEEMLGAMVQKVAKEVLPFDLCDGQNSERSVKTVVKNVSSRKHLLDCLYAIVTNEYGAGAEGGGGGGGGASPVPEAEAAYGGGEDVEETAEDAEGGCWLPWVGNLGGGGGSHKKRSMESAANLKGGGDHQGLSDLEMGGGGGGSASYYSWGGTGVGEDGGGGGNEWDLVETPALFPCAVELHNSGINFRPMEAAPEAVLQGEGGGGGGGAGGGGKRNNNNNNTNTNNMAAEGGRRRRSMISVVFDEKRAMLYLPKIRVGDETEALFRNLVAYESHKGAGRDVGILSYLRFMNGLVDTAADVELLVEKGVIVQDIGSNEEVATMWNKLCVNTMRVCNRSFDRVARQLKRHSRRKANILKAEFKRIYFSRPWLLLSLLSAASLLIMTLVTMLYTIGLYHKPGAG